MTIFFFNYVGNYATEITIAVKIENLLGRKEREKADSIRFCCIYIRYMANCKIL